MKRKLLQSNLIIFTLMLFCVTCFNTFGQQSKKISLQGFLKDANGKAVTDAPDYKITFKLYTTLSGGTAAWSEDQILNVSGGVYSTQLGKTVPLESLSWGSSTYYVGVNIGTVELSPRTELTFAPYSLGSPFAEKANFVVCSGALGDVKYSVLNPQQFALVNGSCWVPMDGGNMSNSKLAAIIGGSTVPNAGGLFLRGQPSQNGATNHDPERSPGSAIATYQADGFASHKHTGNTSIGGNHTHGYLDSYHTTRSYGFANGNGAFFEQNTALVNSSLTTNPNGDHNHTLNIDVNGGTETRSKNLNLWTYIRIN